MPNKLPLPTLVAAVLLMLFTLLGWQLFAHAPDWRQLGSITLDPKQGTVTLGYQELGQHIGARSADHQHLQLRYDATAGWMLSNLSAHKTLLYKFAGEKKSAPHLRMHQWQLAKDDIIQLDGIRLVVKAIGSDEHLLLEDLGSHKQARWQSNWLSGGLSIDGQANFSGCEDSIGGGGLFYLGGNVQCSTRWQLPGLPTKAALVKRSAGGYVLAPLAPQVAASITRGETTTDLMLMEIPIRAEAKNPQEGKQVVSEIIVGKTTYRVKSSDRDPSLMLIPIKNIHMFTPDEIPDHEENTVWGRFTWPNVVGWRGLWPGWAWAIPLGLGVLLAGFLAMLATDAQRGLKQHSRPWLNFGLLLFPLMWLWLGTVWNANLPMLAGVTTVSWFMATLLLAWKGLLARTAGWLWVLILFLAGFGLLVQMQLAMGAEDTSWHQYASRQALSLLGAAWFVVVLAVLPRESAIQIWERLSVSRSGKRLRPILSWLPPLIVLASLLVLGKFGGEGGVGGIQPAEFAKLVMALLLAIAAVTLADLRTNFKQTVAATDTYQARHWLQSSRLWRWLRLLGRPAVMGVMALVILGSVRDFSPILILFLLLFAFVWVWRGEWPKTLRRVILLLPMATLTLLVAAWFLPETFASLLPQGERILVWHNPWAYPDLGLQLQRSLQAVHGDGLWSSWLNPVWYGVNGPVMNVPAVQNDFILAFVFARFGALGGLLLLVVQLCWVGMLFGLQRHLLALTDTRHESVLAQHLLAWLLYGLAWLQIAHWLISWCNVLGLLPIMGQPMTWLSSGNSHLFALALPGVMLALLAARYLQLRGEK